MKGKMKPALTIAGSDSSGGAGIQADIKTMIANGVYAMSAITALTAQNTTGVFGVQEVSEEFLELQIKSVVEDIFPDAVKTGIVSSSPLINTIADEIEKYGRKNVVVDPVMISTSGSPLINDQAIHTLQTRLFPLATVITPNIPEASVLCNLKIKSEDDMEKAASMLAKKFGCSVLLKGGHSINDANDFLYELKKEANGTSGHGTWFNGKRIKNPNTHGTGCTLSSAIASNLAKGYDLATSIKKAKVYISKALSAMLDLGKGSGPMNHGWNIK